MKIDEIREMPSEEITQLVGQKKKALFNFRFQRETEQLERPAELRKLKTDIARLLTTLRERKLAEGRASQAPGVKERSQKA